MMTCPANQYLVAQHRDELLREAERDRLAQAALAGAPGAPSLARRTLHELSRQLLTRVRHAAQDRAAAPGGASPA